MYWNLLNYPDPSNQAADTNLRHPYYRTVIQFASPDILITGENTSAVATGWFQNNVMNSSGAVFSRGTFINGPDTDNEIYYNTSQFTFVSNIPILTNLRDINEFKLVHIATGDTIRIYAVHLKASSGSSNEALRAAEVDSLRKITNWLPAGSNFIVCGDFNIYGSTESAYSKLLQNNVADDGNFIDPIFMTGTWNQVGYSDYHTQSTRTTSFGGGSTGGLDDRFDMILFSTAIDQGNSGITYMSNSTTPIGNDGNHYSISVNSGTNTSAPATVINALYNASDHLPVSALFEFAPAGLLEMYDDYAISVFPNPVTDIPVIQFRLNEYMAVAVQVFDGTGRKISETPSEKKIPGEHWISLTDFSSLSPGVYTVRMLLDQKSVNLKVVKN